eukprot:CAMPEP_0204835578 /NCGR_PEP_ID=MMETSP1346-20131115/22984_1 /ASSEMBLY_ACC=CAM_ASM_000771 /TAXON_ID=215587 /ORGANISM="Aplanochytrium stocchinoi, Strain GSBS06" /LENGTH=521 /DNA_ID=CAMNT_0051969703 /DNA_START=179 /DNA_END=1744 /DNA_ORIENTATION=+
MDALFEVAQEIPVAASQVFSTRLARMQKTLHTHLLNLTKHEGRKKLGGDYGFEVAKVGRAGVLGRKRKAGGHKGKKGQEVLAEEKEIMGMEVEIYGDVDSFVSNMRCWPTPGDFAFLRALSIVFPVTDFRHTVVSPAKLLLGEYISSCPIRGHRDLVACLFTIQLLLEFTAEAKRIAPEVIVALEAVIGQALMELNKKITSTKEIADDGGHTCFEILSFNKRKIKLPQFEWFRLGVTSVAYQLRVNSDPNTTKTLAKENKSSEDEEVIGDSDSLDNEEEEEAELVLPLSMLKYDEEVNEPTLNLCHLLINAIVRLIDQAFTGMGDTVAVDGLFGDLNNSLSLLSSVLPVSDNKGYVGRRRKQSDSMSLKADMNNLAENIYLVKSQVASRLKSSLRKRKPLRLYDDTPKPIKTYTPDFNDFYTWSKYGDEPDKRKVEMKKLKKQLNREKKGAARELRKDAIFISEQKDKEKLARAKELRAERLANRQWLEAQSQNLNAAIRDGAKLSGGGTRDVNMKGRRRR